MQTPVIRHSLDVIVTKGLRFSRRASALLYRHRYRIGMVAAILVVFYGILGFFAVPYILRRVLTGQVAAAMRRRVTVGPIRFNPYRLRLRVDRLHITDHSKQGEFASLSQLEVKVSWSSLYRLAPVVTELNIVRPAIDIVRS